VGEGCLRVLEALLFLLEFGEEHDVVAPGSIVWCTRSDPRLDEVRLRLRERRAVKRHLGTARRWIVETQLQVEYTRIWVAWRYQGPRALTLGTRRLHPNEVRERCCLRR